ncbi:hypothetical protein TNCT1_44940 [Streptomyces sp. 1-11]|nr:hypothetical protein TNCT1_44940 [Streptomyces sp. 1-11]
MPVAAWAGAAASSPAARDRAASGTAAVSGLAMWEPAFHVGGGRTRDSGGDRGSERTASLFKA